VKRELVLALALATTPAVAAPSPMLSGGSPSEHARARSATEAPGSDEVEPIHPDPRAVAEAREANLEPESIREGLAIGVAVGPNIQVGFGIRESSGTGGSFALRFGTVASPRWVWLAELASTAYKQQDEDGKTRVNQSVLFTLGGQLYLKEAFWLRGGGGLAQFTRRTLTIDRESNFWGVGVIGAGGLDIVRRRSMAVSVEALSTLARYRDGVVAAGTLQLGVSWY